MLMKKRAIFVSQLKMLWGTIEAVNTEVPVPDLLVNVAGAVTVELIAPQQPGTSNIAVNCSGKTGVAPVSKQQYNSTNFFFLN